MNLAFWNRQEARKTEKIEQGVAEYFKLINAYSPAYRTFSGGVYEMELTRAAIHAKANCVARLKPIVNGTGNQAVERMLQYNPNPLMDAKKYLYRIATMLFVNNNAFIAPMYDDARQKIVGLYPLHPDKCQLKKYNGKLWLVYEFQTGEFGAIEFEKCGRLNQFQNKDELFGESNAPMNPTLQMMNAQDQAIINAVKNSANIKILAKLAQTLKPKDVEAERDRFVQQNFTDNKSEVLLIDAKYADVKQMESKQFTVDDKQMAQIRENVFDYFGVSEEILQGKYTSDEFNSFYESQIEPVALELSLQHTNMLFTPHEVAFGNNVVFTANRFNFLNSSEKVTMIQTLFDRGLLTPNEAREIINMSPIENGDNFYIRKEYTENYNLDNSNEEDSKNVNTGNEE